LGFERADIIFQGVDQSGPSFEARVFVNNPKADLETPPTADHGYAGSFHVYGYGIWPADIGKDRAQVAAESEINRAPIQKTLIATDAIRKAASRGKDITVTVVPVYPGNPPRDASDAFKLETVNITVR
jgi:hypothetical protein